MNKIFIRCIILSTLLISTCICSPISNFFVGVVLNFTNTRIKTQSTSYGGVISKQFYNIKRTSLASASKIIQNTRNVDSAEDVGGDVNINKKKNITLITKYSMQEDFKNLNLQIPERTSKKTFNNNGYNFNFAVRYFYTNQVFTGIAGINIGFNKKHSFNLAKKGTDNVFRLSGLMIVYDKDMGRSCCDFYINTGVFNLEGILGIGKTNGIYYYAVYFTCMIDKLTAVYTPYKKDKDPNHIQYKSAMLYRDKQTEASSVGLVPKDGHNILECIEMKAIKGDMEDIKTHKKEKVCFCLGLGAEIGIAISKNMIIVFGFSLYPTNTTSITIPAYKDAMPQDKNQFGSSHKITMQTIKLSISWMYKIG